MHLQKKRGPILGQEAARSVEHWQLVSFDVYLHQIGTEAAFSAEGIEGTRRDADGDRIISILTDLEMVPRGAHPQVSLGGAYGDTHRDDRASVACDIGFQDLVGEGRRLDRECGTSGTAVREGERENTVTGADVEEAAGGGRGCPGSAPCLIGESGASLRAGADPAAVGGARRSARSQRTERGHPR